MITPRAVSTGAGLAGATRRGLAASVVGLCVLPAAARAASPASPESGLHFPAANPDEIGRWIGPPPPPGSRAAHRDMDELIAVQVRRSAADRAAAQADAELSIFDPFVGIFGRAATAEALPATTRFLAALVEDTFIITAQAKSIYRRARPNAIDPRVRPCIEQPATSAYPSGHGVFMYTAAEAFTALAPEHRDAIFARAEVFAYNRVVGGIHFPSDATASRTAAALYYAFASSDPGFAAGFAAARREFRAGLRLDTAR